MKGKFKIVSGGQTGVDQGALEAAVDLGVDFGGWAPHAWLAEKPLGCVPERYRPHMREYGDFGSNAENYRRRTRANVLDSYATLILVDDYPLSGGTLKTKNHCDQLMRSHLVMAMNDPESQQKVRSWLSQFLSDDYPTPFVLNVAGPRESKAPGIQQRVREFLCAVFCT